MPAAVTVAAVVVTHDRLRQLRLTLRRLLAEEGLDRVLVVDNASRDETRAFLAGLDDARLSVLRLEENRGGAGGFEAGLREAARLCDPDWCLLLDDDARPLPGAIAAFRQAVAEIDPDARGPGAVGALAAAVFTPSGEPCEMNRPSRNPFWHAGPFLRTILRGGRKGFHLPDAALDPAAAPAEIDVASFVGFFVSRAARQDAGLPDGGVFLYGDDVLYSLRLRRAGFRMRFLPQVRFEHDCATLGPGAAYRPLWKVYYHCRNGVGIARAAAGPMVFPAALLWYLVLWSRRARHYAPAERTVYRRLMWEGVRDGLLRRQGRNDRIHALADRLGQR